MTQNSFIAEVILKDSFDRKSNFLILNLVGVEITYTLFCYTIYVQRQLVGTQGSIMKGETRGY